MSIEITSFQPDHADRFAQLNREWLEAYGLMEPANEEQLADPRAYVLPPALRPLPAVATLYLHATPPIPMKTRIVPIGNSQGIRIPKLLLEQSGLAGDVELRAEEGRIVIEAVRRTRAGWAKAAAELHERGEDGLIETPAPTFGAEEWEWR